MHGQAVPEKTVNIDGAVRVIDPSTDKLVGGDSFPVNSQPTRIAAGRGEVWALSPDTHGGTMSEIDPRSLTVAATRPVSAVQGVVSSIAFAGDQGWVVTYDGILDVMGAVGWRYTDHVRAQRLRRSLGCRSDRRVDLGGEPASAYGVQDRPNQRASPRRKGSDDRCSGCRRRERRRCLGRRLRQVVEARRSARIDPTHDTVSGARSCFRGFPATSRSAAAESG